MSDFKAKMHKIRFQSGLRPYTVARRGILHHLQTPELDLRALLLKGGVGIGKEGRGRDEMGLIPFLKS